MTLTNICIQHIETEINECITKANANTKSKAHINLNRPQTKITKHFFPFRTNWINWISKGKQIIGRLAYAYTMRRERTENVNNSVVDASMKKWMKKKCNPQLTESDRISFQSTWTIIILPVTQMKSNERQEKNYNRTEIANDFYFGPSVMWKQI